MESVSVTALTSYKQRRTCTGGKMNNKTRGHEFRLPILMAHYAAAVLVAASSTAATQAE
jgi:hypothetical protein